MRKLIWLFLFGFAGFVLGWKYITVDARSAHAKSAFQNPEAVLYLEGEQKTYIFVPDLKLTYRKFAANKRVRKILNSPMGEDFLSSPPLRKFHQMLSLVNLVPSPAKWEILFQVFPGGIYYGSTERGSSLIAPLSRLGKQIFAKAGGNVRIEKNYLVYSTWPDRQVKKLGRSRGTGQDRPVVYPIPGDMVLRVYSTDSKTANAFAAIHRTMFPAKFTTRHDILVRGKKSGPMIISGVQLKEGAFDLIHKYNRPGYQWPLLSSFDNSTPLAVETSLPPAFFKAWLGDSRDDADGRLGAGVFLQGFRPDYGILLPAVAAYWSSDDDWTDFFASAFKKGEYDETKGKYGESVLKPVRYRYYRGQEYYSLGASLKEFPELKDMTLWASTTDLFATIYHRISSRKKTSSIRKMSMYKSSSEEVIFKAYSRPENLLKNSLKGLENVQAIYSPDAFQDFTDTLRGITPYIKGSSIRAQSMASPKKIRTIVEWKL